MAAAVAVTKPPRPTRRRAAPRRAALLSAALASLGGWVALSPGASAALSTQFAPWKPRARALATPRGPVTREPYARPPGIFEERGIGEFRRAVLGNYRWKREILWEGDDFDFHCAADTSVVVEFGDVEVKVPPGVVDYTNGEPTEYVTPEPKRLGRGDRLLLTKGLSSHWHVRNHTAIWRCTAKDGAILDEVDTYTAVRQVLSGISRPTDLVRSRILRSQWALQYILYRLAEAADRRASAARASPAYTQFVSGVARRRESVRQSMQRTLKKLRGRAKRKLEQWLPRDG